MKKLLIILLVVSLLLNIKHVFNKDIYGTTQVESPPYIKPVNKYYAVLSSQYKILPIDSNSIVFLGNSLTQLFDVTEFFNDINVKNRGIGGDTTIGVLNRIDEIITGKPKKIFIEIGTNDLQAGIPVDTVANNILKIIDKLKTGCKNIYLQNLLPCGMNIINTNKPVLSAIIALNKQLEIICKENNITYIDLYSSFIEGDNLSAKYDCGDHLHINSEGYLKWKSIIEKYVN